MLKNLNYSQKYEPVRKFFLLDPKRLLLLKIIYKSVPLAIAAVYLLMAVWLLVHKDDRLIIFAAVPCGVFIAVSIIRRALNRKRPYEGSGAIIPLIVKDKTGQSFPSRHALSAALAASFCMIINIYVGLVVMVMSFIVAVTRVLAGVHYPSDVIAGLITGYAAGGITAVIWLL